MSFSSVSSSFSWLSPIITSFRGLTGGTYDTLGKGLTKGKELTSLFFEKIKQVSLTQHKTNELEWVISDDLGERANVDLNLITTTLDTANIPYTIIPAVEWPPKNQIPLPQKPGQPIDLFSAPQEIVWESGHVKIAVAKEQGNFHLLVKPARETSLAKISAKEYVLLKRAIANIPALFEKVFGSPDFCEALVESKTTFGFEIFPGSTHKFGTVDLLGKDKRALYLLSRGRWISYSLPANLIETLKKEIPIVFSNPLERQELPFQAKREETNLAESREFRVNTLLKILSNEGFPVMAVKPSVKTQPITKLESNTRNYEVKRCFLCSVKKEEVILTAEKTLLVTTIYPFVKDTEANESKHVLIAPVKHVTDCIGLTDEEVQEERKILLKLRKTWDSIYPNEEHLSWRQQGIAAGQTVPHLHIQALTSTPKRLHEYYVITIKDFVGPVPPVNSANVKLSQGMRKLAANKFES